MFMQYYVIKKMPIQRVNSNNNEGFYFITSTVWNWYYLFDRHNRWEILGDSVKHCQLNKGLEVYSYVFMLNHMIIKSPDVSGFLRDFKSYTSKKLLENIEEYEPNVLKLFDGRARGYKIWQEDNMPKLIEEEDFFLQKMNYIHSNPVKKGYVLDPSHWKWSSACLYSPIKTDIIA